MSLVATQHAIAITEISVPDQPQRDGPSDLSRLSGEHLIDQRLAALASQYQTSDYYCIKYGPRGAPAKYVPLSVQAPDFYRQLQEQQASYDTAQAWWPCTNPLSSSELSVHNPVSAESDGPTLIVPRTSIGLQEELTNAISSPLTPQVKMPQVQHVKQAFAKIPFIKTSDSHPINITFLIPTELIPLISFHLVEPALFTHPAVFDIPPPFQLHHLLCSLPTLPNDRAIPSLPLLGPTWHQPPLPPISKLSHSMQNQYSRPPGVPRHAQNSPFWYSPSPQNLSGLDKHPLPPISLAPRQSGIVGLLWNQKIVKTGRAIIATANVGFKIPKLPNLTPLSSSTVPSNPTTPSPSLPDGRMFVPKLKERRLPRRVVPSHMPVSPSPSFQRSSSESLRNVISSQPPSTHCRPQTPYASSSSSPSSPPSPQLSSAHTEQPKLLLGNLLLSSCPGKKVRLSGPSNGRSGVCRDLRSDLQRIRDIGVECVVCCLDDEELQYLGAPWEEYVQIAGDVGLDVLRIPIPEGLAPLSVHILDDYLAKLISMYTLNGKPILVHCRGGVGRAGLVACCWAIKLGLCGCVGPSAHPPHSSADTSCVVEGEIVRPPVATSNEDVVQLVERVILLLRRRRSAKAIETYEQVRFMVDYVEFLRAKARAGKQSMDNPVDSFDTIGKHPQMT